MVILLYYSLKKMIDMINKKIISVLICILFVLTILIPLTTAMSINKVENSDSLVFLEIESIDNKALFFDDIIGDINVRYWEHFVDDVRVMNDSILLHIDKDGGIIKYEKNWCEIESKLMDYGDFDIEIENYDEKQLVMFPDEEDVTFYFTFYDQLECPVVCWEVCYSDGSIIFYDLQSKEIGYAIPMPSNGFSMSGHNHLQGSEDPWKNWRTNANMYFEMWTSTNVSISLPPASTVSSYVSDPSFELFFEIAHGDHTRFRCVQYPSTEVYYHSTGSWNYCAQNDMEDRQAMRFAFIGSCGGMDETGPGSFSDEFRKGQMEDTATIGYTDMDTPAWYSSFKWQNFMFTKMDEKETMYDAFLAACAEYPIFVDVCKFVGDGSLKIQTKSRFSQFNPKYVPTSYWDGGQFVYPGTNYGTFYNYLDQTLCNLLNL